MSKTINFIALSRDWKQSLKASELVEALRKVEKTIGGEAQVREDMCVRGDDCITTCIFPANIHVEGLVKEDVVDVFGWTDRIHIANDGKLFFQFEDTNCGKKHGLTTDKWLSEEEAVTWITGLMAAEDIGSAHKSERAGFLAEIEKAKKLV